MIANMQTALLPVYKRFDVSFEKGEGCYLYDDEHKKYLDCGAGIAVNALGYNHPKLVNALKNQAEKIWHISNLFYNSVQTDYADSLTKTCFADYTFFTNSGAEAIECAIKIARRYFYAKQSDRHEIIAFSNAFHGRTLATIAAAGQEKLLKGFAPHMPGFVHVPFGDHNALKAAITHKTAAILIEPIQGEGGIVPVPNNCLIGLRELCDEHGILLIFDEIQTGFGRTGKLFAHEYANIEPDIMAVAKGIGGGFPLGACLATKKAASGMDYGSHGSTYGGNLLGMAVAKEVLNHLNDKDFLDDVADKGIYFIEQLNQIKEKFPHIINAVRGKGLLIGIELNSQFLNTDIVTKFLQSGLVTIGAGGNVIRLIPPLIITKKQIDDAIQIIENVFNAI